jgi:hypothetical protein
MIQLDENHWVQTPKDVQAIRPMFIPSPDALDQPNRRGSIIDPERCIVLIGGDWVQIERGAQAIARLLDS